VHDTERPTNKTMSKKKSAVISRQWLLLRSSPYYPPNANGRLFRSHL